VSSKASVALAGAQFTYTGADGVTHDFPSLTDASGHACVENLPFGSYTVAESSAPTGFNKDASTQTVTISSVGSCANGGATAATPPHNFVDVPLTDLVVKATSEVTTGGTSPRSAASIRAAARSAGLPSVSEPRSIRPSSTRMASFQVRTHARWWSIRNCRFHLMREGRRKPPLFSFAPHARARAPFRTPALVLFPAAGATATGTGACAPAAWRRRCGTCACP
jgi:hypothetical protein